MKLAELVKQRTNGDVEITIFPANQLGNDAAMINGTRGGTIDIVSSGADNFPLMAVPFFMLAGELMNAGGMSRRIVESAMVWVGHFRGGLGYVAVFAAIVMASL